MENNTVFFIGICFLLLCLAMGIPVAYGMLLVGLLGYSYMTSLQTALALVAKTFWSIFSSYELSVIPLFVLMGTLAFYAEIGNRIFRSVSKMFAGLSGGFLLATIIGCALFGSICGSTAAAVATMGRIAYPEMEKRGYNKSLSSAAIATAGSLAILIPPSNMLIIYGVLTQQSIGMLFAGGILPGILLTSLLLITVWVLSKIWKNAFPKDPKISFKERFKAFLSIGDVFFLFILVLGGLFLGWFTPTEAGAAGVAGVLGLSLMHQAFTPRKFLSACYETAIICGMIFLIVGSATVFGYFAAITQFSTALVNWIESSRLSPIQVASVVIVGYMIGGCFFDSLALVTLTIPILFPVMTHLGFDPIWFGIIVVLVVEMGVITPPVGINVFILSNSTGLPTGTVFKGVFPFFLTLVVATILILLFPSLATLLPNYISY